MYTHGATPKTLGVLWNWGCWKIYAASSCGGKRKRTVFFLVSVSHQNGCLLWGFCLWMWVFALAAQTLFTSHFQRLGKSIVDFYFLGFELHLCSIHLKNTEATNGVYSYQFKYLQSSLIHKHLKHLWEPELPSAALQATANAAGQLCKQKNVKQMCSLLNS